MAWAPIWSSGSWSSWPGLGLARGLLFYKAWALGFQGLSWQLPMLHSKSSLLEACPKWCVSSEGTEGYPGGGGGGRWEGGEGGRREARGSPASQKQEDQEAPAVGSTDSFQAGAEGRWLMGAQRAWSATRYPVLKPRSSVRGLNSRLN